MGKNLNLRGIIARGLIIAFLANIFGPVPAVQAQEFILPSPGRMVALSPAYSPAVLKGIKLDPKNPFRFHFFVDTGDDFRHPERSEGSKGVLKSETAKLIKYFLASLTIPEQDLWVNLSPYEKDRIIPSSFGQTEMGRDLLAEDYFLKQITASLIYPESQLGKEFWQKVYAQAQAKYGTTNIPINTFNKVWIVPDKAVVYENGGTAFVLENHLKVMMEEDYLSLQKHASIPNGLASVGADIIRQIVIPALTKEVNEGKNFAQLRQVFYSLILATWYKKKIKDSILVQVYENKRKIAGVGYKNSINIEGIYHQYLQAFKKGVYNYIKDTGTSNGASVPRKYFSGGVNARLIGVNLAMIGPNQVSPAQLADLAQQSIVDVTADAGLTGSMAKINADGAMTGEEFHLKGVIDPGYFKNAKSVVFSETARRYFKEEIANLNNETSINGIRRIISDIWSAVDMFTYLQFRDDNFSHVNQANFNPSGGYLNAADFIQTMEELSKALENTNLREEELPELLVEESLETREPGLLTGRSNFLTEFAQRQDIPDAWKTSEYLVDSVSLHMREINEVGHSYRAEHLSEENPFTRRRVIVDLDMILPHLLLLIGRYAGRGQHMEDAEFDHTVSSIAMGMDPNIYPKNNSEQVKRYPQLLAYRRLLLDKLLVLNRRPGKRISDLYARILLMSRQGSSSLPLFDMYTKSGSDDRKSFLVSTLDNEKRSLFDPAMPVPLDNPADGAMIHSRGRFESMLMEATDPDLMNSGKLKDFHSSFLTQEEIGDLAKDPYFHSVLKQISVLPGWEKIGVHLNTVLGQMLKGKQPFSVQELSYLSPVKNQVFLNTERVHARYFVPKGISGKKLPAIVIPSFYEQDTFARFLSIYLASQGAIVLEVGLPLYGKRSSPGTQKLSTVNRYVQLDFDPNKFQHFFIQSVADTIMSFHWLAGQNEVDGSRVSMAGQSKAGAIALGAYLLSPKVNNIYALVPSVNEAHSLWNGENRFAPVRQLLERKGYTQETFDREMEGFNMDQLAHAVGLKNNDHIYLGVVENDELIPYNDVNSLREELGRPMNVYVGMGKPGVSAHLFGSMVVAVTNGFFNKIRDSLLESKAMTSITFEEAKELYQLKRRKNENISSEIWSNPESVKQYIYAVLDTYIPGFEKLREQGEAEKMADLYRKKVIEYPAQDKKKYKKGGQFAFFCEIGKMSGLMGRKRDFLDQINSPSALIKFALKEMINIDGKKQGLLELWEIENDKWDNEQFAENAILDAFDSIKGFKWARQRGNTGETVKLYIANVKSYKVKRGKNYYWGLREFLTDHHLKPLMARPRAYLKNKSKTYDSVGLVRFALPNLYKALNAKKLFKRGSKSGVSRAQLALPADGAIKVQGQNEGGINLNPTRMSMQIRKEGKDFKFDFNGTMIDAAQVTGVTFTIRQMTHVTNLPLLLGLDQKSAEHPII